MKGITLYHSNLILHRLMRTKNGLPSLLDVHTNESSLYKLVLGGVGGGTLKSSQKIGFWPKFWKNSTLCKVLVFIGILEVNEHSHSYHHEILSVVTDSSCIIYLQTVICSFSRNAKAGGRGALPISKKN